MPTDYCAYCGEDIDDDELHCDGPYCLHEACFPIWKRKREEPAPTDCNKCALQKFDCGEIHPPKNCEFFELKEAAPAVIGVAIEETKPEDSHVLMSVASGSVKPSVDWHAKYDTLYSESVADHNDLIEKWRISQEEAEEWEAKYHALEKENVELRACIIGMLLDKYGGAGR